MSVLVLRPQPEADETAEALRARGHAVVVSPLLAVRPGDPPPSGPFDAVAVTSPRALPALAQLPAVTEGPGARPPLFAVGERCAALAEAAGWRVAAVAADARGLVAPLADHLVALLADHRTPAGDAPRTLYAAPAEPAFDLAGALRARGADVTAWTAYRTVPRPLTAEARAALREGASVLLSSPRIAEAFAQAWRALDPAPRGQTRLLAISPAAARPMAKLQGVRVEIAGAATLAGLLELL